MKLPVVVMKKSRLDYLTQANDILLKRIATAELEAQSVRRTNEELTEKLADAQTELLDAQNTNRVLHGQLSSFLVSLHSMADSFYIKLHTKEDTKEENHNANNLSV